MTYDLTIAQRATFSLSVVLTENGATVDTTGCSAIAQIRQGASTALLASFTVSFPSPSSSGVLKLVLSSTTTSTLPPGTFLYDVLLTRADGTKGRVLQGSVVVTPAISIS